MTTISQFTSINVGSSPNDGTGDNLRAAFTKVNQNFANIARIGIGAANVVTTGVVNINNQTNATNIISGALTVAGGIGIAKDVYVGGNLIVQGAQIVTNKQTVLVSEMVAQNLNVGYVLARTMSANAGTASSSSSTGDLVVVGGVGIGGNLHVGSSITAGGINATPIGLTTPAVANFTDISVNSLAINTLGGVGTLGNTAIPGTIDNMNIGTVTPGVGNFTGVYAPAGSISEITGVLMSNSQPNVTSLGTLSSLAAAGDESTSFSTGAAQINGGVGITGNVYVGAVYTNGLYWAANNNVMSTGTSGGLPSGLNTQVQFNDGGHFGASPLSYFVSNSAIVATSGLDSTSTTTGAVQVQGGLGVTGNIFAGNIYGSFIGDGSLLTNIPNSAFTSSGIIINTGFGLGGGNSSPVALGGTVNLVNNGVTLVNSGNGINVSATTGNVIITNTGVLGIVANVGLSANVASGTVQLNNTGVTSLMANIGIGLSTMTGDIVVSNYGVTRITGTTNQINSTSGTGNITLSLPQNINSTATPSFSGVTLNSISHSGTTGIGDIGSFSSGFGNVYAANVIATKFFGDGSGLINVSSGSYTNSNVAAYLPTYTGNVGGTITTAAQPGITSVGTLGSLTISGNVTANGYVGTQYGNVNTSTGIFSGAITLNSSGATTAIINGGTTGTGNIGSSTSTFNTVYAKATTAQYADLAELYIADAVYEPGTVVVFGGSKEITACKMIADVSVAGVVSTNPAYLMNSGAEGGTPVALRGRVPVRVTGKVTKGDLLVTSEYVGCAASVHRDKSYGVAIFAKALEDKSYTDIGVIEAVII